MVCWFVGWVVRLMDGWMVCWLVGWVDGFMDGWRRWQVLKLRHTHTIYNPPGSSLIGDPWNLSDLFYL